jgi:hypothetical protein
MAVGAAFNGTSSYIESTTGVDLTHTNITVGIMAYFTANTGTRSYLSTASTTTVRLQPFMDENQVALEIPGGSFCETDPEPPGIDAGQWRLVFISKATGSSTPRCHVYDGTTWFHGDLDSTLANASGVIDRITLGCEGQSGGRAKFFSGEMAVVGIWGETTNDATSLTYTNYTTLAAKSNQEFFTGISLISGGTMADSSAHANNETGRSGISAGAQTIPAWFTNFGAAAFIAPRPIVIGQAVKTAAYF